ncbi:MAG: NADH:flavin oxidoreductase [Alphaproteobacteria bacterium]|jgi:2,4-dienoyl-CoA reductase-like NADH-dependent reductase (Old Yellow Enzyme family)|nr:NADH:flavin oxidoreductase [Alphaproteobacteria bacterium]MDP6566736.1 NADH:flavin oxidoreductase [Alphaproteobacteria bacterium]MDP6814710.1 NADH:flavin oxidoreductase [Alphaproteobacteria bacterium]
MSAGAAADRDGRLFQPLDINGMAVPNRVVVPAMVTRLSGEDGLVNDAIIDRYVRYAEGRVGLIVVEATAVHGAKSGPLLRLSDDQFIAGHRELAKRVHDTSDSKVVPQIIHFLKVARSGWRQTIEMLEAAEIGAIIEAFGLAALRARQAGYDGLELHSAHAYTLSSFLSRHNRRKDGYGGHTLEGRLRLFGEVMAEVRRRAGDDFPVGVRFLAEEAIKDGYALPEAQQIALRMARLGVDYISLSVGGKFEDAVHRPGQPLYPYTGYSGDRCMPGDWYPALPHAHLAAGIKQHLNDNGFRVPVISAGKISEPEQAEMLLRDDRADLIGMARQLLADPDWPRKVMEGRQDEILRCVYCNVCKQLDENFKQVTCFLWPKRRLQAPTGAPAAGAPGWPEGGAGLAAEVGEGRVKLNWSRAVGEAIAGYDIYRADGRGEVRCVEAVKGRRYIDRSSLGGESYRYFVRAFDTVGRASPPSEQLVVDPPMPDYSRQKHREAMDV